MNWLNHDLYSVISCWCNYNNENKENQVNQQFQLIFFKEYVVLFVTCFYGYSLTNEIHKSETKRLVKQDGYEGGGDVNSCERK